MKTKIKNPAITISYIIVLAFHAVAVLYIAFKLIFLSDSIKTEAEASNIRLMLAQCLLACVVIHAPFLLQKLLKVQVPSLLYIMYWIFLFCSVFLGEVASFYYLVPHWDDFLHFFSSFMTGLLGYIVFSVLIKHNTSNISPVAAVMFAFCFSVTIGALWEIYEFSFDGLLKLNMQKFAYEDGVEKIGRLALLDTMKDIIVDSSGALLSTIFGLVSIKTKRGFIYNYFKPNESEAVIEQSAEA